jgi:hypothetical protein
MSNIKTKGLVLAFAFAAGEFLDEEIEELKEMVGEDHAFIKQGIYINNKRKKRHNHEWWVTQESVDDLNKQLEVKRLTTLAKDMPVVSQLDNDTNYKLLVEFMYFAEEGDILTGKQIKLGIPCDVSPRQGLNAFFKELKGDIKP